MNWKTELENFITSNVENNFPSIQTKRSSLAACVTKACNIAAKTQEEATRSQTFQEDEVKQNIHLVNEAIGILKHFSDFCIKTYKEKMKIDVQEEYSLYLKKYSDKAAHTIREMESLLQHSSKLGGAHEKQPPGKRSSGDDTSGKDGIGGIGKTTTATPPTAAPTRAPPGDAQGFQSWTPAPLLPTADGTPISFLMATLGANFDISNTIPKKFNGTIGTFPEYFLRLQQADKQMASYGYSHNARFMEMLKSLEGLPLKYCNLSLTSEESYVRAIDTLKKLYGTPVDNPFRQAWKQYLRRGKCIPTWESRSSFHAEIVSLFNLAEQMPPNDVYRELVFINYEEQMDPDLRKEWAHLTSKNRDENNSLGHSLETEQMADMVLEVMLRDLRIQQTGSPWGVPPRKVTPWRPRATE